MPSINYTSSGKPAVPTSTTSFTGGSYTVPAGKVGIARVTLSVSLASNYTSSHNAAASNTGSQTFTVYAGQVLSLGSSLPAGTILTQTVYEAAVYFQISGATVQQVIARCYNYYGAHNSGGIGAVYIELYDQ